MRRGVLVNRDRACRCKRVRSIRKGLQCVKVAACQSFKCCNALHNERKRIAYMMPCGMKREQALQCPLLVLFKLGYACLKMCDLGLQVVYLTILHALLRGYR